MRVRLLLRHARGHRGGLELAPRPCRHLLLFKILGQLGDDLRRVRDLGQRLGPCVEPVKLFEQPAPAIGWRVVVRPRAEAETIERDRR